jgi:hypothetical protein
MRFLRAPGAPDTALGAIGDPGRVPSEVLDDACQVSRMLGLQELVLPRCGRVRTVPQSASRNRPLVRDLTIRSVDGQGANQRCILMG